ncbi:P-loop containing nucleoside triphosphate hydrolase protein [Endogone sp. FLAS-F59071]|nr:P-loop containing nucleoside triphosphate hydrolase protein [Endogone sp. FLAS-F59071]|eukprot:RUS15878.1 P-loop containing nucleoside triphosphate hydrolase protein [Endogone sp. FLAS-F59071]
MDKPSVIENSHPIYSEDPSLTGHSSTNRSHLLSVLPNHESTVKTSSKIGKVVAHLTEKFHLSEFATGGTRVPFEWFSDLSDLRITLNPSQRRLTAYSSWCRSCRVPVLWQRVKVTAGNLNSDRILRLGNSTAVTNPTAGSLIRYIDHDTSRTIVFAADQYGNWCVGRGSGVPARRTRSRPKRPLSTIVMDPMLKQAIVDDAHEFLSSEQWYSDRGIPYRRGYLLYGSPGSGKTSFIYALAGELGHNIYVINLSSRGLTNSTLGELVTDTPRREGRGLGIRNRMIEFICLLVIKDVDAAFVQREKEEGIRCSFLLVISWSNVLSSISLLLSNRKIGLLNAIDGVAAQEGRILCMTTKYVDFNVHSRQISYIDVDTDANANARKRKMMPRMRRRELWLLKRLRAEDEDRWEQVTGRSRVESKADVVDAGSMDVQDGHFCFDFAAVAKFESS